MYYAAEFSGRFCYDESQIFVSRDFLFASLVLQIPGGWELAALVPITPPLSINDDKFRKVEGTSGIQADNCLNCKPKSVISDLDIPVNTREDAVVAVIFALFQGQYKT